MTTQRLILLPGNPPTERESRETKQIKEKLLSIPSMIAEQKRLAREARIIADSLRAQMQEIEAETLFEINTATNASGKPLFGNEAVRNAELKRRLARNPEYISLRNRLQEAENRHFQHETLAGQLMSEFSAWKAVAELTAAEISAGR